MSSSRSAKVSSSSFRLSSKSDVSTSSSRSSSLNKSSSDNSALSSKSGASALERSPMSESGTGTSSLSAVIVGPAAGASSGLLLRLSSHMIRPPTNNSDRIAEPIIRLRGLVSALKNEDCFSASRCACSALIMSSNSC